MSEPATSTNSDRYFESVAPPKPVLSTRLYQPRLKANLVERSSLIARLDDDPDRHMTLICAPAGYGKTTLAAQWVGHLALPTAWVTLEADDNDLATFFGLITAALHRIDRDLAAATAALYGSGGAPRAEAIASQLIEDLSVTTHPFVLVLDDYHVIEERAIHQVINLLIQHLPTAMRLVLISRTMPSLHLARLETSGELVVITQADMQFTSDQTLQYFHACLGVDLTPTEVELLLERTEGWVVGLQLVGTALRGRRRDQAAEFVREFVGSAEFGDQYLWEEVLERQPDAVRTFLLHTSVLDSFNASLCDAVTGTRTGSDLIRRCERENLFIIPLEGQGGWYRYHHLFTDFVRDRLSRTTTEDEIVTLHRRAAEWLKANGYVKDAIRHAIAGRQWEHAVGLLEGVCNDLFERDHIMTLRAWLEGIPSSVLATSPRLAFWLAWARGRTGRWSEGTAELRIAEEAWTATGDRLGEALVLLWHAGRALWGMNNKLALEYSNIALNHLPADRPVERILAMMTNGIAHLNHGLPGSAEATFSDVRTLIDTSGRSWYRPFEMTYSAAVLMQQGKLLEASLLSHQVVRSICEEAEEIWCQAALYHLGRIYLEWGLLDDAERALKRGDEQAEAMQTLHWRSQLRWTLARVRWVQGRTEEALDEGERAVAFANQFGTLQIVRNASAQQARFWLQANRLALVRRWADSSDLDPYLPPEYEREFEHLTYVRLLLHQQRPDLALPILRHIDQHAEASGRHGDRVEILVLTALAHKANNNAADAFKALHDALELGSAGGYLRTFVDEGENLTSLLRHASTRASHRDYGKSILAEAARSAAATPLGPMDMPDALSEREIEVLRLVAAGLANRDISQRLFISEKTVKTHLSNIMGKLGASNRTQAVDQARQLGVL